MTERGGGNDIGGAGMTEDAGMTIWRYGGKQGGLEKE
jgi:hypothetical protein